MINTCCNLYFWITEQLKSTVTFLCKHSVLQSKLLMLQVCGYTTLLQVTTMHSWSLRAVHLYLAWEEFARLAAKTNSIRER